MRVAVAALSTVVVGCGTAGQGVPDAEPDNAGPELRVLEVPDSYVVHGTISITAVAADPSGVARAWLEIDGAIWSESENSSAVSPSAHRFEIDTGLLLDGDHRVRLHAVDAVGHSSSSEEIALTAENPVGLVVASFHPPSAGPGTWISITGGGFTPGSTTVEVDGNEATVLHETTTGILVRMPGFVTRGPVDLTVETAEGRAVAPEPLISLQGRSYVAPPERVPESAGWSGRIDVKFAEGTRVRVREEHFVTLGFDPIGPVLETTGEKGARASATFTSQSEAAYEQEQFELQQSSGEELGDPNLWFQVYVDDSLDVDDVTNALNALDIVESAFPHSSGDGIGLP